MASSREPQTIPAMPSTAPVTERLGKTGKLPTTLSPGLMKKAKLRVALFGALFIAASIALTAVITWLIYTRVHHEMLQSFTATSRLQLNLITSEFMHIEGMLTTVAQGVEAISGSMESRYSVGRLLAAPLSEEFSTIGMIAYAGYVAPPCGEDHYQCVLNEYGLPANTTAELISDDGRRDLNLTEDSAFLLLYRSDMPLDVYGQDVLDTGLPLFVDSSGTTSRGPSIRAAAASGNLTASVPAVLAIGRTGLVVSAPIYWSNETLDIPCPSLADGDFRGLVVAVMWSERAIANVRRETQSQVEASSNHGYQAWFQVVDTTNDTEFMSTKNFVPITTPSSEPSTFNTWYRCKDFLITSTFRAFGKTWTYVSSPTAEFFDPTIINLPTITLALSASLFALICALLIYVFWQRETRIVGSDLKRSLAEAEVSAHEHVIGIVHHEIKNPLHIILAAHHDLYHLLQDLAQRLPKQSGQEGGREAQLRAPQALRPTPSPTIPGQLNSSHRAPSPPAHLITLPPVRESSPRHFMSYPPTQELPYAHSVDSSNKRVRAPRQVKDARSGGHTFSPLRNLVSPADQGLPPRPTLRHRTSATKGAGHPANAAGSDSRAYLTHDEYTAMLDDVQSLGEAALHLKRQVEEMMDVSQMRSGKFSLKLEVVPLVPMVERMCKDHETMADVPIHFHAMSQLEDQFVTTDAYRIRQLLANGLTNACKITKQGSIRVHVGYVAAPRSPEVLARILMSPDLQRVSGASAGLVHELHVPRLELGRHDGGRDGGCGTDHDDDHDDNDDTPAALEGWITISIQDSGPGLRGVDPDVFFQPYISLLKAKDASSLGGTGLGLPIARQLSRAMGGDARLRDTGSGAEYFVALPVPTQLHVGGTVPRDLNLIPVEGSPDMYAASVRRLSRRGRSSSPSKEEEPSPSTGQHIVLVHSGDQDTHHPYSQPTSSPPPSVRTIDSLVSPVATDQGSTHRSREGITSILVVDDEPGNCRLARRMTSRLNMEATLITSPCKSFEAAMREVLMQRNGEPSSASVDAKEPEAPPIDAVLLDLNLAGERGRDIFRNLRATLSDRIQFPAVYAVSGTITPADRQALMAEGFAGAIEKPFNLEDLRRLLGLEQQ